ncbi:unnamed protein product [Rangifer tarandus platyrhynchus]|uniref:Uncharacterized protein n=1 Tax=Rangifer tarandus platyrhynchus TaxID=3082113 RepID=A0AC60A4S2_RANTA
MTAPASAPDAGAHAGPGSNLQPPSADPAPGKAKSSEAQKALKREYNLKIQLGPPSTKLSLFDVVTLLYLQ